MPLTETAPRSFASSVDVLSHTEGPVARSIEEQTAKLPSDTFLWASLGAIATSLVLQTLGKKAESLFIGQWAPTFLILGLYNKIVSDAHERASR